MIPFTGHDKVNPKHYLDKSRLNLNANGIYIHISICPSISTCVYTYMYIYIYIAILHIYITYISYRNYPKLTNLLLKVSRHE